MGGNRLRNYYLAIVLILILLIFTAFAINLYRSGSEYPAELVGPDRMRDAMYAIYALVGAAVIISLVWIFAWVAMRRNQTAFDSSLTEREKAIEHSILESSLPISLRGDTLRVNRGLFVQSIDLNEITYIHLYINLLVMLHRYRRALTVVFHRSNGRRQTLLFERGNATGVRTVLEQARLTHPHITILDESVPTEC
ncbi:MAG: hypothetical protein LBV38_06720 [Alistipes sp.]|nr:hypothetical protein [Alistipes sp.]